MQLQKVAVWLLDYCSYPLAWYQVLVPVHCSIKPLAQPFESQNSSNYSRYFPVSLKCCLGIQLGSSLDFVRILNGQKALFFEIIRHHFIEVIFKSRPKNVHRSAQNNTRQIHVCNTFITPFIEVSSGSKSQEEEALLPQID